MIFLEDMPQIMYSRMVGGDLGTNGVCSGYDGCRGVVSLTLEMRESAIKGGKCRVEMRGEVGKAIGVGESVPTVNILRG